MELHHAKLVKLLQQAYSAERAASFAYQGHAGSLKTRKEKDAVRQIEIDEWNHRAEVLSIMNEYQIKPSRWNEVKFFIIGKIISWSCYVIGRFMPFYFAGRLESGNVCEYFVMKQYFNELGIYDHDKILYEMGMKEKDHEAYFAAQVKDDPLLPLFEKIFRWSASHSFNNIDLENRLPVEKSDLYCEK